MLSNYTRLIATIILLIVSLCNLLVVKGFIPSLFLVLKDTEELLYDVSLAIFTGTIVYLFTTEWPLYSLNKMRTVLVKTSMRDFNVYALKRLDSIKGVDFAIGKERVNELFNKLQYGTKATGGTNGDTIYQILIKIKSRQTKMVMECEPLLRQNGSFSLINKLNSLESNQLFSFERKYLKYQEDELENENIEIGRYIHSYYWKLKNFDT